MRQVRRPLYAVCALAVLALGSVWFVLSSFRIYKNLQEQNFYNFYEPDNKNFSDLDAARQLERERAGRILEEAEALLKLRADSFLLAQSIKEPGKYIFDGPRPEPDSDAGDDAAFLFSLPQPVDEVLPEVTVKAVMLNGKKRIAVIDAAGIGKGLVLRQGDTFTDGQGGQGRVERVERDRVVLGWRGRTWEIVTGF